MITLLLWLNIILLGIAASLTSRLLYHHRVTTFLAASLAFFEVYWLLGALLLPYLPRVTPGSGQLIISLLLAAVAAALYLKFKQPFTRHGSGPADMVVLLVLILVLGGAALVASYNGPQGTDFVIHGFYNGDVVTFASLVQKAIISADPVIGNPFAANGVLEYPTLLHRGWAMFFSQTQMGLSWLYFWPLLVYLQIIITIPLIFLLWDVFLPEPDRGEQWLGIRRRFTVYIAQGLLTLGMLTLSWDNYIYPQSHFFLTAAFLLQGAILFSRQGQLVVRLIVGLVVAVVLLLSNAVTGTAALILFAAYALAAGSEKGRSWNFRLLCLAAIVVLAALFLFATPGNAALGSPHFSYTAVVDIMRLSPWLVLLLIGIAWQFPQYTKESFAIVGVTSLTFIVFVFSSRDIVVANASRFIYHGLLLGLPLLLRPLLRAVGYLRREVVLSSRSYLEYGIGAAIILLGLTIFLLPSMGSVASAYDNLLFNDEQRISFQRREVLWWLADHTPAASVIVANPTPPWDIPLFSGRALLRASDSDGAYWLSPDDQVLDQLQAAFTGDTGAQKEILAHGDYLVLTADEGKLWPMEQKPVLDTKGYQVYQLR